MSTASMATSLGLSKVFILDKYFSELQKFWETEKRLQGRENIEEEDSSFSTDPDLHVGRERKEWMSAGQKATKAKTKKRTKRRSLMNCSSPRIVDTMCRRKRQGREHSGNARVSSFSPLLLSSVSMYVKLLLANRWPFVVCVLRGFFLQGYNVALTPFCMFFGG